MANKESQPNAEPKAAPKAAEKKPVEKTEKKVASEPGKIEIVREFIEDSKAEIKKVTWPTKTEVRVTTIAVLILVTVMSIFLGVLDLGLVKAVEAITSLGK